MNSFNPVTRETGAPRVCLIVPNKNGKSHLEYSLKSISELAYPNYKVIVVDNCSSDDSVRFVRTRYPEFAIIQKKQDTGFAGSVNSGLLAGLDSGADFFVVFSNDVRVHPKWLSLALSFPESFHNETGIIGFYELERGKQGAKLVMPERVIVKAVSRPECPAIYVLKRKMLQDVGLYDEAYYMYCEDIDFFHRCLDAKYKILQTNIPVWHRGEGFSASVAQEKLVSRCVYRNSLRFEIKTGGLWRVCLVLAKLIVFAFAPLGMMGYNQRSSGIRRLTRFGLLFRAGCLAHSILWNLRHLKETLAKRKQEKGLVGLKKRTDSF